MTRSIPIFGFILVAALGGSWMTYTTERTPEKDGIILVDNKPSELQKITYKSPDADVVFEMKEDALGRYAWVTVTDHKKKKVKEGEPEVPPEIKVTAFKAGQAGDKLIDAFAPMAAMRELTGVDDVRLKTFGLTEPDTTVALTSAGKDYVFDIGGEVYGPKDRYARYQLTSRYYIIDDELIKPLKFAATRLPERALYGPKPEEMDSITLGAGAKTVTWTHKNKDDASAVYWEREGATGKDETFANWVEKALKLKSQSYVQDGAAPTDLVPQFDMTIRQSGKPDQTVRVSKSGEDWYAQSEYTRGLVKLTKGPASDAAGEVVDILEGRTPPPKPEKKSGPPAPRPGGPPAAAEGGDKDAKVPPMPGGPPMPGRPMMPGRPAGAPPKPPH